ncbi:MAG: phosphoadenosine phosphosulfate reductase family protein [Candidatus Berkiellales bacterium]
MILVVRCNYGDDSIALLQALKTRACEIQEFNHIYVVYIDTGWAAEGWLERVREGEQFVKSCGFEPIHLKSRATFADLVIERKNFPTQKFQWCAGFLKGLPLLEWLDEHDPKSEWLIALPKRQALYRQKLTAFKKECQYHGERDVWHPILMVSNAERDLWMKQAGFLPRYSRSLECDPCVNSTAEEFAGLSTKDKEKVLRLELTINQSMPKNIRRNQSTGMDAFSMGCGDPFGCGL